MPSEPVARALRILVWQWGRRGAGPRVAADLAAAFARQPDTIALLSLSSQSELMRNEAPVCHLPVSTYDGLAGFLQRVLTIPARLPALVRRLRALAPDVAICAMPAPLDLLMGSALRRLGVPFLVMVHDADAHPGDGFPGQMLLQRRLVRRALGLVTLSGHVAGRLAARAEIGGRPLIGLYLPAPDFAARPQDPPPGAHDGRTRLLFFGRLLPYKGLDLFEAALRELGPTDDFEVRLIGHGPETPALRALRAMPGVSVENRWVPEAEIPILLGWADAVVLSHVEASQSGVAAAAMGARRWLVATGVGGIVEQLQGEPLARLCAPTPRGLATAIRSLRDDPPRERSPAAAGGRSWDDMAAALLARIRPMIGAAAPR